MDAANMVVDTGKPLSHDQNVSIEAQLHVDDKHGDEIVEFIETPKSTEDLNAFINAEKSHTNGLLDPQYGNIIDLNKDDEFLLSSSQKDAHIEHSKIPANIEDSFKDNNDAFHSNLELENFCGFDKLNENLPKPVNDDVEEFVPNSEFKKSKAPPSPLLDFDSPSESKHDEFESHFAVPPQSKFKDDSDLLSQIKDTVTSSEGPIGVDSATWATNKEVNDLKFSEVNDSSRSGTPDFLELDQDEVKPSSVEKVPEKLPENVPIETGKKTEYSHDKPEIGPKEIFSKYGLDIWFNPERLNPAVEAFIYWRDPKLSAIVFVSGLVLLLSMAYYSLISVIANTGLTILVCAMGFRLYKHVLQAVQKTDQAHPYSVFLDWDLKLPQEKVHELLDTVLIHINAYLGELRRLFLVENWLESIKFAIVLWVLTYVGSWFNGLTLVIIGFVSLFTLPKVYENNKVQIDQNLALVHVKLEELTNKIKDVLPALLRKKAPEKKE